MSDRHRNPIDLDRASAALRPLARLAAGATGADIERVVRELNQKSRREGKPASWSDIEAALRGNRKKMPDDLAWRIAVHEAGHALCWTLLEIGRVELVTIGNGEGGVTEGRLSAFSQQDEEWVTRMIIRDLAGRAAELLIFGNAVAGSGGSDVSDLAVATGRATLAETVLGFAQHQPLLYRETSTPLSGLGLDHQLRDRVNKRLEAAMERASALLAEHRHILVELAEALMAQQTLEGDDVRRIVGAAGRVQADGNEHSIPG